MWHVKKKFTYNLFFISLAFLSLSLSFCPEQIARVNTETKACCCAPNICRCVDGCSEHHSQQKIEHSAGLVWKAVVCDGESSTIFGTLLIPKFYLLVAEKSNVIIWKAYHVACMAIAIQKGISLTVSPPPPQNMAA